MVSEAQWTAVREALESATAGFASLLESAPASERRTVGRWTVADTGVHVAAIAPAYHALLTSPGSTGSTELDRRFAGTTLDTVSDLNRYMMPRHPVREPGPVAAQLRADVDALLRDSAEHDPWAPVWWLGGAQVPVAGVLAHLLNELLIHGRDVARATGAAWSVPPADAVHFFTVFMAGMLSHGYGDLLGTVPSRRRPATVEFRLAHAAPFRMVLGDGYLASGQPGPGADAVVRGDPATLALMLFRRLSKVRATVGTSAGRRVVVHGRRPWVLVSLLRTIRMP